jgi:hypothetical protein
MMISKRRRRRLRGKFRAAICRIQTRTLEYKATDLIADKAFYDQLEDGYGPEALAVLDDLIKRDDRRRPFTTAELSPEQVEAIERSRMDARHDHLNKLLD